MNISLLVLNDFTNDARVNKEAATLAKAGHDVTVVALWNHGLEEQEQSRGYQIYRIRLRSRGWRNTLIAPLVKYIEFTLSFLRYSRRSVSQVYHANDANTLLPAWLAAYMGKAALIYDAHELETGRNFGNSRLSSMYQQIWAWPEKIFIHSADGVLTVSESIADELVRLYDIPRPVVLRNVPESVLLTPQDRLRRELSIPAELKIVLYQGGVMAGRGIEPFLDAIQGLPAVVGVILGDGPLMPFLRIQIDEGRWKRVYLPGRVSMQELPSYTASADLGIVLIQDTCLSYRYSLPNKLFETIQAGIPVLGSNLPDISAIIREYEIGAVANSNSPDDIQAAIQQIFADRENYEQLKKNAREAARTLNWENESTRLLDLIETVRQRQL